MCATWSETAPERLQLLEAQLEAARAAFVQAGRAWAASESMADLDVAVNAAVDYVEARDAVDEAVESRGRARRLAQRAAVLVSGFTVGAFLFGLLPGVVA